MINRNSTNFGKDCARIGYDFWQNCIDISGRYHKYCASPQNGNGSIAYFATLSQAHTWITQVSEIHTIENDPDRFTEMVNNKMLFNLHIAGIL